MSIVVDLERLGQTLADYPFGYLLTTSRGAVKAVTVSAHVVDGEVDIPVGSGGSARNLADNPTATLLFPPTEPRGYSLIVDGTASATERGFRLSPAKAVLHRPADHADAAVEAHDGQTGPAHTHDSACGHDCRPV
ncbi:MAG: pyridoxamine 5'-phosphate oxidase [Dermatophilaceae bacterium]